jgi:hypothetical protein
MNLGNLAESVSSRDDFAAFVDALRSDLSTHPAEWENQTLERFLEALSAWVRDMDGYYQNHRRPVPATPDWRNVAEMLLAAKIYE